MKWVCAALLIASSSAWGQAAAEYGVVTSKSAAATVTTMDKLNQATSGVTKKALKLDPPASETVRSVAPRKAQPPAAKPATRVAGTPAATQAASAATSTASQHPSTFSIQGGVVRRSDPPGTKYPSAIQIPATSNPPPNTKPPGQDLQ